MKTLLLLAITACLVASMGVTGLHTAFKPCVNTPEESASVQYLDVNPCEAQPCSLRRGSMYTLSLAFNTSELPKSIPAIKADLYAIIHGVKIELPGFDHPDACKDCNLKCPLAPATPYLYKLPVAVPSWAPVMEVVVEALLTDTTTGKSLVCVLTQIKIV